ncbi:MAG: signal transduction protein [Sphingobacteriaceae bacterium]|nr:signal transduction protein [Sphingobacteriaceae bacterium]
MLKELILKESVKTIFAIASKKVKGLDFKLDTTNINIDQALSQHIQSVKNWSNEITFKDLKVAKQTTNVFIPLDLFIYPLRIRMDIREKIEIIPLLDIFKRETHHIAILGQPGAGKTTSMKFFCQSIFFDEKFYPEQFNYPLLIKLRDFNRKKEEGQTGIIFDYLFSILGLKISVPDEKNDQIKEQIARYKKQTVLELIDKLKILLIIDGFDELAFKSHKEIVLDEISILANHLENSKLILTSRTAEYSKSIENISVYELCPLNETQIKSFSEKWLGKERTKDFLKAIVDSPYNDTSIRPLTIAHLCAIYERIGNIPEKPKTVYRKIINLLLEEWDEQRSVKRTSKYALFEIDRKFEFLSNLAYHLTLKNGKSVFSDHELLSVYESIHIDFDLSKNDSRQVVNDLESHTGLFVQAGFNAYEFAHKSLQEYLTAEYLVKLPSIPVNKRTIEQIPNELAIAVTISSNSSLYFVELIEKSLTNTGITYEFIKRFMSRLIIEKPDFNQNQQVGVAALKLYSMYINKSMNLDGQLRIFNADNLIYEFEQLISNIFKRNSKDFISGLYNIKHTFLSEEQSNILLLERKLRNHVDSTLINTNFYDKIPIQIYCRESFLNPISI